MKTKLLLALAGAATLALPLVASAESNVQTGTATATPGATAHASNSAIDLITFSPTAAQLGSGTGVAGTGGDLTAGVETAAVVSNSGNVTLNATATGALSNGAGDTISFSQITTTATTLTSATALPAPTLTNATSANVLLTAPSTKVIVQDAKWTFAYANSAFVPTGTYGGVNTNNGRVTYTATMP